MKTVRKDAKSDVQPILPSESIGFIAASRELSIEATSDISAPALLPSLMPLATNVGKARGQPNQKQTPVGLIPQPALQINRISRSRPTTTATQIAELSGNDNLLIPGTIQPPRCHKNSSERRTIDLGVQNSTIAELRQLPRCFRFD